MTRAAIALAAAIAVSACGPAKTVAVTPAPSAPGIAPAQRLQADLSAIFETPQFERSFWSVLVTPAEQGADLYSLNAAKLMMPGSVMKMLTAAAAAELLGWEHQFETKIVAVAPVDQGVLRGDLIVIGGGDPSISERSDTPGTLRTLARQVREAGITRVEGGIIGHDDLFDDNGFGDGWTLDNLPYGYAAAASALEYNEGSVDLVIRAGDAAGDPVVIEVRPEGGGLQIDNKLVTVAESGTGMLTLKRLPGSPRVIVQGQIPAKAPPFVRTASVDNPTAFFVSAFRAALVAEGIQVNGDAVDIDDFLTKPDLAGARAVVSHKSATLRQIAASMMRVSQNQYAETLLKAIGGRDKARNVLSRLGPRQRQLCAGRRLGVIPLQLRHLRRAGAPSQTYARRSQARGAIHRNSSCHRSRRRVVEKTRRDGCRREGQSQDRNGRQRPRDCRLRRNRRRGNARLLDHRQQLYRLDERDRRGRRQCARASRIVFPTALK